MPEITLPTSGSTNWAPPLITAIETINTDVDLKVNSADPRLTTVTLYYNSTTDAWPSVPGGLASGTVIWWDSAHDPTAPVPPDATVGYRWIKAS